MQISEADRERQWLERPAAVTWAAATATTASAATAQTSVRAAVAARKRGGPGDIGPVH